MDDGGFFGKNRPYYEWLYQRYRSGYNISKCAEWMYRKDMAAERKMRRPVRREK